MRHLRTNFSIILIILVLTGFAQANPGIGMNCIECKVNTDTQPSCCQKNAVRDVSGEYSGHSAPSKSSCPHAELCKGMDTASAVIANSTFPQYLRVGLSSSPFAEKPVFSSVGKEILIRPPPLWAGWERYILLCSFLI
jgi:hypothetical protein